jgi:hypothetical protein
MQPQQGNPIIKAVGAMGGRLIKILPTGIVAGPEVAWPLVRVYLAAEYSREERHPCRLETIATLENIGRRKS